MKARSGGHLAPPAGRTVERVLFGVGAVAFVLFVVCAVTGAEARTGLVMVVASCVFGGIADRMRTDPSAWRLSPGKVERRVWLIVLGTASAVMGLAGLIQIADAL